MSSLLITDGFIVTNVLLLVCIKAVSKVLILVMPLHAGWLFESFEILLQANRFVIIVIIDYNSVLLYFFNAKKERVVHDPFFFQELSVSFYDI